MKKSHYKKQLILNDYRYGRINLFKAIELLIKIGISRNISRKELLNIQRQNLFKISEYQKTSNKNTYNISLIDDDDDEYYFDISFDE